MFYLPRYIFHVSLAFFIVLGSIHLVFRPAQNSWYSIILGFVSLAGFLLVYLYYIVKKLQLFKRWKNYRWWVNFHIFAIFAVWVTVLFHSAFVFDSLFFWVFTISSLVVFLSGITGQYFFIKIPRTGSGLEESKSEIIHASEDHALRLLKAAIKDPKLFELMDHIDTYIRQTSFFPKRNLFGLISNDLRISRIKNRFLRELQASHHPRMEEYKALIFKRLTIELKIAHMNVARRLLKRWMYFHLGAISCYTVLIFFHVYSKLMTVHFSELVWWNWN